MSPLQSIQTARSAQTLASLCTWKMGERILRASLPFLSACGYVGSLTVLAIRMAHGDENQESGISNQAVKYWLIGAATPLTIATTITGASAAKQLCTNGYYAAKNIVMESVKPEGLMRRVFMPGKEMAIIGESCAQMEYASARSTWW